MVEDKVQVRLPNLDNSKMQHRYSIEDDEDIKLPLAHIRKMQNTTESETLAIDKIIQLTTATIGRRESDISI